VVSHWPRLPLTGGGVSAYVRGTLTTLRRLPILLAGVAFLAPAGLSAQFQAIESGNMRLVYTSPLQSYLVPQVAASFENALRFHRRLFDYTPPGPINILMHDLWHFGNAGARPVPENHVTVGIAPYAHDYESAPAPERMASSMNHELAHIVTTDRATRADEFYRSIFFGKVTPNAEQPMALLYSYLTTPRWYAPRWYLEGIATYLETWMNGGLGRALGPYDEMVFRTLVRDSLTIYDVVGLESEGTTVDFQVGVNSYLYGTRFISYLALQYGNDSLLTWVNRAEGSRRYFSTQFKNTYGVSLEDEWAKWIAWERNWQRDNLTQIRRHPTTVSRPLTPQILGSVSRAYYDEPNKSIFVAVRYPGQEAHIASIDVATGELTRIGGITAAGGLSVTSLAFDSTTRTLFYTTNNADWRHILAMDLRTGESRMLMENSRVGDIAYNAVDRSLWGVRHDNGFSTLVRLPHPYNEWKQVLTLTYGRDIFDLDVSPDGTTLIASLSDIGGKQLLVSYNIAALTGGNTQHQTLFDFGDWSPSNFVFSRDGKFLFGSSYYSGVSNVFRLELATRDMQAVSNAETGYFKPLPISNDSLIVFEYSGTGFVPAMIANRVVDSVSAINFLGNEIAEKRPDVQTWMPPPASEIGINADSLTARTHDYNTLRNFKLDNAYPVVEGYEDAAGTFAVAGGVRMNFSDRVGATGLDFTVSYSPEELLDPYERLHARAVFRHWNWKVSAALNRADFYDLFGPTKMSRRGHSFAVQYSNNFFVDGPTSAGYVLGASTHGDLAILPEFQDVASSFSRLQAFNADINYKSLRRSLGAIEDEVGGTFGASIRGNYVNGELFPRLTFDASRGFLLPIDHSSVWFRASAGSALAGDRTDPFARYYFGGFANNYVDYRGIKQFRNAESFPGLEINQVSGATYAKAQFEWTSPPLRFRSLGIPSAYFRWASFTLFGTGLMTDLDDSANRRTYQGAGAQIDIRLITLSNMESTFSVGWAAAKGQGVPLSDGLMFSFKIM
jgi:hypothetical protein